MTEKAIGRVISANKNTINVAAFNPLSDEIAMGAVVQIPVRNIVIYGVVSNISYGRDPFSDTIAMVSGADEVVVQNQMDNPISPIEIEVGSIGYVDSDGDFLPGVPMFVPPSLTDVFVTGTEFSFDNYAPMLSSIASLNGAEIVSPHLIWRKNHGLNNHFFYSRLCDLVKFNPMLMSHIVQSCDAVIGKILHGEDVNNHG